MSDFKGLDTMSAQCLRTRRAMSGVDAAQTPDADADARRGAKREAPRPADHPRGPLSVTSAAPAGTKISGDPLALVADMGAVPPGWHPAAPPAAPSVRATRSRTGSAKKRTARTPKVRAAATAPKDAAGQAPTAPPPTPLPVVPIVPPAAPGPASSPSSLVADWDFIIQTYFDKPVEFAIDILGVEPDDWQAEVMREVAAGQRRIAIRAGHGVGKTAFCAWLVIWFLVTRYPQKTVLTAPSASQLFDALFAEVKFWMRKLPAPILDLFEMKSESIELKGDPEGSFVSAKTSSVDRPEAMAGVHSANVLLICDEASAIPEAVYEAAAGSMSGFAACTILISNPTRNTGL